MKKKTNKPETNHAENYGGREMQQSIISLFLRDQNKENKENQKK